MAAPTHAKRIIPFIRFGSTQKPSFRGTGIAALRFQRALAGDGKGGAIGQVDRRCTGAALHIERRPLVDYEGHIRARFHVKSAPVFGIFLYGQILRHYPGAGIQLIARIPIFKRLRLCRGRLRLQAGRPHDQLVARVGERRCARAHRRHEREGRHAREQLRADARAQPARAAIGFLFGFPHVESPLRSCFMNSHSLYAPGAVGISTASERLDRCEPSA